MIKVYHNKIEVTKLKQDNSNITIFDNDKTKYHRTNSSSLDKGYLKGTYNTKLSKKLT